ncbi:MULTISPECIES: hypothetical protein [Streptococcaceae]|uniref:Uncharacterized protein n=1 Tax=Pseudolactococcus raffinolactis TaxID=1366 RepID=A0A6H0UHW0_9LACT|nr:MULTISPECIES: hypothetical protein [Lactococcus]MDR7696811.1 hypothetical protein [Lactococcus lactis]QIW54363.1 hypothetical protein GU336_09545 [Lactococcus raffinolactis]
MNLKWWNYPYWDFKDIAGDDDIEVFIEKLERLIKNNEIQEYHPDILTAKDILKVTKKY